MLLPAIGHVKGTISSSRCAPDGWRRPDRGFLGAGGQGDSANGRNFRVARGSETAAPNSGETVNSRLSGVISVFPVIRHAGVAENIADQFGKTCLGANIV